MKLIGGKVYECRRGRCPPRPMAWIAKKALHISATFYAFSSVLLHLQPDLVPSTIEFLRAFEEDKVSYAPTEDRSFAMMTLLPEYFVNPLRKDFLDVVQQI